MWWEALGYYWKNGYSGQLSLQSVLNYGKSARKFDNFPDKPILIGGCGRSGTTLLLAILGAHPRISALDFESGLFTKNRFSSDIQSNHRKNIASLKSFLAIRGIKDDATRWCEKTPKNVRNIKDILTAFQDHAQIVLLCRDGRDTVTSVHPDHEGYFISPQEWIDDTIQALAWKDHPQVKILKYEDLILQFDETIKDLLQFLELPQSTALDDYSKNTVVQNNRAWKDGVQPIKQNSIGKWKNPEHKTVVQTLLELPQATSLLEELGYC